MKKIILITANLTQTGGTERVVSVLANGFKELLNVDVEILNLGEKDGHEKYDINKEIKIVYLNIKNKAPKSKFDLVKNLINTYIRLKIFINKRYEEHGITVIGIGTGISYLLAFVFNRKNNNLIGTQHNPVRHSSISDLVRKIVINKLDHYVVLDNDMKRDLNNNCKLKNIKVISNPLTITPKNISRCSNKQVLAIGRLTYQKGFDMLIQAWNKVNKLNPEWKLVIVGEGELLNNLQDQINYLNLENSISIVPFTSNIEEYYSKSSMFVLSSRYEGFGLVILEAQAFGLPVVAFNCPTGPKNIINDNIDGILVDENNIEELASKISYLIQNEKVREELSKNAIANQKNFSIENIITQWKEII